jgi:xanthine/uracil permease
MAASSFAIISTCLAAYVRLCGPAFLLDYADIPLHLLGGFIAAAIFVAVIHFFFDFFTLRKLPKFFAMLSIMGFVALVTISWEIFEYFSDRYFGTMVQLSIGDTLKDMIVGLLGALPIALAWPRPSHWIPPGATKQGASTAP